MVRRTGGGSMLSRLTRPRTWAVDVWIVLLVIAAAAPLVKINSAQPASRVAFTGAVVDDRSVDITGYPVSADKIVLSNGRLRSDKAPGQPLLSVPFYAAGRLFGMEPARHFRVDENLGLWWMTLWFSALPLALLVVMMRRVALSLGAAAPTAAAFAIGGGTTLGFFGSQLFGHVLAAAFAFGAWYVIRRAPCDRPVPWLLGGLLAGLAVITEYQVVLIAAVLTGFVCVRARRQLPMFVLGALPAGVVGAVYNAIAFGKPWKISYGEKVASQHRALFG